MKNLLILAFLLPLQLLAQQPMSGKVRYLITHNWTKKLAAVDYISPQQREKAAYVWGNRSEWKTYANLFFDEKHSKYEDSDEPAEPDRGGNFSWRKDDFCVTRDREKNRERDLVTLLDKTWLVEDSIAPVRWKVLNELKEVAGHVCMSAETVDTVKKQRIVGWFALDLPVQAGPERLGGLPGLLLEINVNNGGMIVSADKIELRPLAEGELDLPKKKKVKTISEADYQAKIGRHFAEKRKAEEVPYWGVRY